MRSFPLHLYLVHFFEQNSWWAVHPLFLTLHVHLLEVQPPEQQLLPEVQVWPRTVQVDGVGGGGDGEVGPGGEGGAGPGQVELVITMPVVMAVLSE